MNDVFVGDIRTSEAVVPSIHSWFLQNISKWKKIDQLISRDPSHLARRLFIDDPVPFMNRSAHCIRAALANAIHSLGTAEFVEDFWEAEKKRAQECYIKNGYYPLLFNFECYSSLLLNCYPNKFGLSSLNHPEDIPERRLSIHPVDPCGNVSPLYLMRIVSSLDTRWVFVLSFLDSSGAKHAICFDAHRNPSLIYD